MSTTKARCTTCWQNTNHGGGPCPILHISEDCRDHRCTKCNGCLCTCHEQTARLSEVQDYAVGVGIRPADAANLVNHLRRHHGQHVPVTVGLDVAAAAAVQVINLGWRPFNSHPKAEETP